jgi:hypothetical protein
MSPTCSLGLLVSAYVTQITRNPQLGFSRQGAVVARLVSVLRPTCAQYKGFGTLQAHPPSYGTGSRLPQCLRLPAHFPLICVGHESSRVSKHGRCSREDQKKGGGEALSLHLAVVKNAVHVVPQTVKWSTRGPYSDEALRRVDHLYAEEIAGRSQWSVTLLCDCSG